MQPDWYIQVFFFLSYIKVFCFPFVYQWGCLVRCSANIAVMDFQILSFSFVLINRLAGMRSWSFRAKSPITKRFVWTLRILLHLELVIPSQMIQFVFWPWPVDSTKRNADFRRVFRKASKQVLPDNNVERTSRKATVVHTFVSSSVFLCIHISFDPNFLYKYSRSANTRTNCRLDQLYHTHSLQ